MKKILFSVPLFLISFAAGCSNKPQVDVIFTCLNCVSTGADKADPSVDYVATIKPNFGYRLFNEDIIITIGGLPYFNPGEDSWSYDETSSTLTINKKIITGKIEISAVINTEWDDFHITYAVGEHYSNWEANKESGSAIALNAHPFILTLEAESGYSLPNFSDIVITPSDSRFDINSCTYSSGTLTIPGNMLGCDIDVKVPDAII